MPVSIRTLKCSTKSSPTSLSWASALRPMTGTSAAWTNSSVQKKSGQSAGEAGYAGEGKNASLDTGWMAQELGDSCPGLPPPHLTAWRCVPGVHGVGVTQLTTEKGRFSR